MADFVYCLHYVGFHEVSMQCLILALKMVSAQILSEKGFGLRDLEQQRFSLQLQFSIAHNSISKSVSNLKQRPGPGNLSDFESWFAISFGVNAKCIMSP